MRILVYLLAATLCFGAAAPKSDAEIEADIRSRLAESKISTNNFEVRVKGGTAVLTGSTSVIQHKGVATRLAKAGGARKVDNRIRISEAARKKAADGLAAARKQDRSEARSQKRTGKSELLPPADSEPEGKPAAGPAPPPIRRAIIKH